MGMVSEDIEAQTMISSVEDTPKAVKVRIRRGYLN